MATKGKDRAAMFTATEQRLLLETYEEFKDVITKKGNTAAINKAREKGWQEIADRLNASNLSEGKRTWQQVKIKYKNIVQNATKKKTEVAGTGGGPPPASFTPAEELALEINKGRPVLEGIEGGTSSKMISRSIRSEYIKDSVCCKDPPDIMLPGEVMGVEEDEETVSVCSRRPEDADTVLEPSQSGTTCGINPENIKGVYKRYLLKQMEVIDIDIQYKKLKMRKLELEIQQLQKNPPGPKSASGDASLSIEETNKLRAKLGLKPLDLHESKKEAGTKEEPLLAETINPVHIRQQAEMREKLAALKEKRLLNQKLGKVKVLGDEEPWLDDTAAWVERSRKLAKEKEMAEKRAKLLEEMDEEFGVSSLVEQEFAQEKRDAYSSRDLKGLKVQHKMDSFREGETVILTIEDKGVLEEEEDVLVNVGLVDKEKAEKNVELKKKKPDYKPYEEEESVDDMVTFKTKSVLSKYDEEIEGEKKKSFRLSAGGFVGGERERELQAIRENLRNQAQSLDMPALSLANEYYTPQEMVGFKKTKCKVKKIRKKEKILKAHDLLVDEIRSTDFGSRSRGRGRKQADEEERAELGEVSVEASSKASDVLQQSDDIRMADMDISDDEDFTPPAPTVLEEDEAEQELQKQLEKQRKLRQKQMLKDSGEKVAQHINRLVETGDDDNDPDKRNNIVFNATSEFCRTLGDIPTYGLSGNREDQEDMMDFEKDDEKEGAGQSDSDMDDNVGWSTVNLDEEKNQADFSITSTTILDEEPIVNSGLAAALLLCKNKGLLDTQMLKVARVKTPKGALPNDNYAIEDKMNIDDKYSRREEYRGFTQDFKDKDNYKPDIKIEYVDESGRHLTPKEAFRQLSHRFHGKGSGKMKTERRMKKLEEEALLKKMSSSDTPLGTVALLQEKQKSQKTPYIVLSGSGKSMNANTITK